MSFPFPGIQKSYMYLYVLIWATPPPFDTGGLCLYDEAAPTGRIIPYRHEPKWNQTGTKGIYPDISEAIKREAKVVQNGGKNRGMDCLTHGGRGTANPQQLPHVGTGDPRHK